MACSHTERQIFSFEYIREEMLNELSIYLKKLEKIAIEF